MMALRQQYRRELAAHREQQVQTKLQSLRDGLIRAGYAPKKIDELALKLEMRLRTGIRR